MGIGGLNIRNKKYCQRAMGIVRINVHNKNYHTENYCRQAMVIGGLGVHNNIIAARQ